MALGGLKNDIQEREKRGKIKESLAEKMFQSEIPSQFDWMTMDGHGISAKVYRPNTDRRKLSRFSYFKINVVYVSRRGRQFCIYGQGAKQLLGQNINTTWQRAEKTTL